MVLARFGLDERPSQDVAELLAAGDVRRHDQVHHLEGGVEVRRGVLEHGEERLLDPAVHVEGTRALVGDPLGQLVAGAIEAAYDAQVVDDVLVVEAAGLGVVLGHQVLERRRGARGIRRTVMSGSSRISTPPGRRTRWQSSSRASGLPTCSKR